MTMTMTASEANPRRARSRPLYRPRHYNFPTVAGNEDPNEGYDPSFSIRTPRHNNLGNGCSWNRGQAGQS